jgi:imidazolonepropionase-like amidohydrolase
MDPHQPIPRRRLLKLGAVTPAALLAACVEPAPSHTANPQPSRLGTGTPVPSAPASPTAAPSPVPAGPVLYRDAALADGRSASLRRGISVLVEGGRVRWIRPVDGEDDPGGAEVVDASGATIVPGLVDGHSHITGPGGAHWLERFADPPQRLFEYAEANAALAWSAGIRWLRDVGSPTVVDPVDGTVRPLAIGIRDRWRGRVGYPAIRAAGSWVARVGTLPGLAVEAGDADELLALSLRQLDEGADLVKLYLETPEGDQPWSASEVRRVVEAVHRRGAQVTGHAAQLAGVRVASEAGVDAIEHGFELDATAAARMAELGIVLVTTLTALRSFISFGDTTRLPYFAGPGRQGAFETQLEMAKVSVRTARAAGVTIAAGTDFGGGSARANHLAWEVESLVDAGLEPQEALGAATWRGGELLGEADAGVIREGGPADFFLVHGDPLSDPAALWRVWRHA